MLQIAKWYNNYQAPAVLMIDDLSDAYIDVYEESYKNDWGYLCDEEGSSFDFLTANLLSKYPDIKITFFTPYLKHNVINEKAEYNFKKFAIGDRKEFTQFLKKLSKLGHEIAHHGSDHGKYINKSNPSTYNNWIHEWALFTNVEEGVEVTQKGMQIFKSACDVDIVGGKYCGYIAIENSQEIIDKCNFLYWCDKPSYNIGEYEEIFFGKNDIVSFPTNFAGNSFVRLSYLSGDARRDKKKKILKYFQPLYSLYSYYKLYKLYKKQNIISVQEHNSPSTSAGTAQSANIVSDIKSLNKIFRFLKKLSIWYANCEEIAKYIYVRENSIVSVVGKRVIVKFNNKKNLNNCTISIVAKDSFTLQIANQAVVSIKHNASYVINLNIIAGNNVYKILQD